MAQQPLETVQRVGFTDPVIYASFSHDGLTQVHTFDPKATLMVLFARLPRDPVVCAVTHGASHVGLRHNTAAGRLGDACHQTGLLVCVSTAGNPRDSQHLLPLASMLCDRLILNASALKPDDQLTEEPGRRMKRLSASSVE